MSTPPPVPERPRLPWDPPDHFEKRIPEGDNRERLICGRCEFIHYQNPKIVAGAVCTWPSKVVDAKACPDDQMILDVGPKSIQIYAKQVAKCATLVWNGPLGAFEIKPFDNGTVSLARTVADQTSAKKLLSVAGGGDTVAALAAAGVEDKFSYVSTAGGAFLEWMEGKALPGVAALIRAA